MIDQAEAMGISTWQDRQRFGLSLTLGGGEVLMTDMAKAYGVFASGGYRTELNPILEVHSSTSELLYENDCALYNKNCPNEKVLDEKEKITVKHCEFIATHNETGVSIAVEAKSRQKPGVKHMAGTSEQERLLRGDVERLFKKALTQNPKDKPFVIFIDVNAPLTPSISMENKPWFKDIRNILEKYPAPTPDNPEEYTGLFFTNFSPHYDEEKESSPNEHLVVIPLYAKYPMPNQVFGEMLLKAVQNYGFVPNIMEDK